MKRGLSLIILIITIIVMIILSGVVIVSLQDNNIINNAKNAVDKTDLVTYRQELGVSLMKVFKENPDFKKETFNTSDFDEMKRYIPSMKLVHKGMLEIVKGQLVKVGGVKPDIQPEENNDNNDDIIISGNVNMPELLDGMTPVKYEGGIWKEVNLKQRSNDWFDYKNRRWANARTEDGSYWVWIPRFAYSIKEYKKYKTGLEGEKGNIIEIEFLKGTEGSNYSYNLSDVKIDKKTPMIVHPAFEFDGKPITGFWVAKYKASKNENLVTYIDNKNNYTNIKIGKAFSTAYTYAINNNINGYSHLMKNTEWGAVAYLASSKYGFIPKRDESTTGNETGVYGMNSTCGEFVAAYMDNNNINISLNGNESEKNKDQIEEEAEKLEEEQEHIEDKKEKETLEAAKKVKEEEKIKLENIKKDLEIKIEYEKNKEKKEELKEELDKIKNNIEKIKNELKDIEEELEDVNEDLEEYLEENNSSINKYKLNRKDLKIDPFYGCQIKKEFIKEWNKYDVSKLEKEDIEEKEANNVQRKSLIDKIYQNMGYHQGDALYETINTYSYLSENSMWIINPEDGKKNIGKSIYNGDSILLGNFSIPFAVRGSGLGIPDSSTGIFSIRFGTGEAEKNVSFRTVLIGK